MELDPRFTSCMITTPNTHRFSRNTVLTQRTERVCRRSPCHQCRVMRMERTSSTEKRDSLGKQDHRPYIRVNQGLKVN